MVNKDTYYENFSKFLLHSENVSNKKPEIYSYSQWSLNPETIERIQLNVLKHTLKTHDCLVHGNKKLLIMRLNMYYTRIHSAIKIQKVFRGFIVRESERLRGPALKNRSICTNDTDFETMDPLDDIPRKSFFSYMNANGFIYGFNVMTLMSMYKHNKRKIINPYNREEVSFEVLQSIFSLYLKIPLIYGK
jgi:hypothetical protein